jgi:type IV pilus assembly protein PilF
MNQWHFPRLLWWPILLASVAVTQLAGCAAQQGASSEQGNSNVSAGKTDIVTESDEPEVRRRARLRLELASGYFEAGQTTVALDEVKQALAADPTYVNAWNIRGLIYMRLGEFQVAEESFKRGLSISARDANLAHNYGWMLCQRGRYAEAFPYFSMALANPTYGERAKTLMTQGLCQMHAGNRAEAERSLLKAYELDAGNPVTGYNLALLLYQRADNVRAQFYIRRLNNTELANAETLWLGVKVERRMKNAEAMQQLGDQLKKRFPQSREASSYDRSAWDE